MRYVFLVGVLTVLLVTISIVYFNISDPELKSFLMNLSTELIGAGLTYVVFDQILQLRDREEHRKQLNIASKQFNQIVLEYTRTLCLMYKASSSRKPEVEPKTFKEFFNEDFLDTLKEFDIQAKAPAIRSSSFVNGQYEFDHLNWLEYLYGEFKKSDDRLDSAIDKYAFLVDHDQLEPLVRILNARPSHIVEMFARILGHAKQLSVEHRVPVQVIDFYPTAEHVLRPLIEAIVSWESTVESLRDKDAVLKFDWGFWAPQTAPQIGDSRIKR